jgi:hypothetical protein
LTKINLTPLINLGIDIVLTCSAAEVNPLTFGIGAYNGGSVPSWASIDSANEKLKVDNADSSQTQNFQFYANAYFGTEAFSKLIDLTFYPSAKCTVDNWDTWVNGDSNTCQECSSGYSLSAGKWVSDMIGAAGAVAKAALAIGVLANIASPQGSYSMINQFQIFLLMPLTDAYFPQEVITFLTSIDFTMFSFSFLPIKNLPLVNTLFELIDFDQTDSYYDQIGLESGSTFINHYTLFVVYGAIGIAHVTMYFVNRNAKKVKNQTWIHRAIQKTFDFMTFNIYIRMFIEAYLLILVSSLKEPFYFGGPDRSTKTISLMLNFVFMVLWVSFFFLSLWQWIKSKNERSFINQYYFNEFFEGVKMNWYARAYSSMFLGKRILLCLIVIPTIFLPKMAKITFFVLTELVSWVMIWTLRPFSELKNNIIEITNELFFTIAWGSLFYLNTESNWSMTITMGFVFMLVINSLVVSIISMGKKSNISSIN